ncbi:hypothetical protein CVT24_011238 [Panaeolus cyanescens]|uniref:Uncharacterized protein n=1 Tax=Panaeolus cyanescens TaxID=181874 RepID=A0A409YGK9_9AGAR|nr:hypothetical protein CVT24_011238 [Panaeolus cyanescens]
MSASQAFTVEITSHTDPAIQYGGAWKHDNSYIEKNTGVVRTFSSTLDPNATIKFDFPTPVLSFVWLGFKNPQGGQHFIRLCEDCNVTNGVWTLIDSFDPIAKTMSSDTEGEPENLFGKAFPDYDARSVEIANKLDTRTGFSPMTLEHFAIRRKNSPTQSTPNNNTDPSTMSPHPSDGSNPAPQTSMGALIGGLISKRRKEAASQAERFSPEMNEYHVTPFEGDQRVEAAPFIIPSSYPFNLPSSLPIARAQGQDLIPRDPMRPPSAHRREIDGGPLPFDAGVSTINQTLPPDYGDIVWAHQGS